MAIAAISLGSGAVFGDPVQGSVAHAVRALRLRRYRLLRQGGDVAPARSLLRRLARSPPRLRSKRAQVGVLTGASCASMARSWAALMRRLTGVAVRPCTTIETMTQASAVQTTISVSAAGSTRRRPLRPQ